MERDDFEQAWATSKAGQAHLKRSLRLSTGHGGSASQAIASARSAASRASLAGTVLDSRVLMNRYPRFWRAARLHEEEGFMQEVAEMAAEKQMQMQMQMQAATATAATANQLSGGVSVALSEAKTDWSGAYVVEPAVPRVRSLPWLLQLLEDIYDAAKEAERPFKVATGEVN